MLLSRAGGHDEVNRKSKTASGCERQETRSNGTCVLYPFPVNVARITQYAIPGATDLPWPLLFEELDNEEERQT